MAFMSLKDIDVSYDKKKQILKGLSLDVEKGELVSLPVSYTHLRAHET